MLVRDDERFQKHAASSSTVMDDEVEIAVRRVSEAREIVARQVELIERLKDLEWALSLFRGSLMIFENHLKALESMR